MAKISLDLTGHRYHRLVVLDEGARTPPYRRHWVCVCDCGATVTVSHGHLRNGHTRSCGCILTDKNKSRATHGNATKGAPSQEYLVWARMKQRCLDESVRAYVHYGGRGIRICDRWLHSFENFLADMGERPSSEHSLDRYPDNNGNYEPGNCRWATRTQQGRNQRTNHLVNYNGRSQCVADWSDETGIPYSVLVRRINRGWELARAFSKPLRVQPNRKFPTKT